MDHLFEMIPYAHKKHMYWSNATVSILALHGRTEMFDDNIIVNNSQ